MTSGSEILAEMKGRVEALWQALIYAPDEEKAGLRTQYNKAMHAYQLQREVVGAEPSGQTLPQVPNDGHPSPFDFWDYQTFLMAYLKFYKKVLGGSVETFAGKVGMEPARIVRILRRYHKLELEDHRRIMAFISLTEIEGMYVEALYLVSETDSGDVRAAAMRSLMSFAKFQEKNPEGYESWKYLTHWYYVAIRELSTLPGFRLDPDWIQARLRARVERKEIEEALAFLEGARFFQVNSKGRVETLLKSVNCEGGVFRLAQSQFHFEMLEVAGRLAEDLADTRGFFHSCMVAVPAGKYPAVRQILQSTMNKVTELESGAGADDGIFHLEIAACPLNWMRMGGRCRPRPAALIDIVPLRTEPGKLSPFDYPNYSDFFRAWLVRSLDQGGELAALCREQLGTDLAELQFRLDCEFVVSRDLHRRFVGFLSQLKLEPIEAFFLEHLYVLSADGARDARSGALDRLVEHRSFRHDYPDEYIAWRFLTDWVTQAVLELSSLGGFKAEREWIRDRLRFPAEPLRIDEALQFFRELGFDSPSTPERRQVECSEALYRTALRRHHRELLALAGQSIAATRADQRLLLGYTSALSAGQIEELQRALKAANEEIEATCAVGGERVEGIYFIELALAPLTRASYRKPATEPS